MPNLTTKQLHALDVLRDRCMLSKVQRDDRKAWIKSGCYGLSASVMTSLVNRGLVRRRLLRNDNTYEYAIIPEGKKS